MPLDVISSTIVRTNVFEETPLRRDTNAAAAVSAYPWEALSELAVLDTLLTNSAWFDRISSFVMPLVTVRITAVVVGTTRTWDESR